MHEADYALHERIYEVVREVPAGVVTSYGDVATVVGGGCDARTVGQALGVLGPRADEVPWQRVVNREGGISTRGLAQRALLEAEGVAFDARGHVIMARHRWAGPDAAWAEARGFNTLPPLDEGDRSEQLSLF
jgi:methylated-DNA-protein-cysteine methyltransferase related protein